MLNLLLAESGIVRGLLNVLSMIMLIADAALVVYAVYMFFMMVTAHDEGKRRNVKKHFFNTISSILIILALITTLSLIKVNITQVEKTSGNGGIGGANTFAGSIKPPILVINRGTSVGSGGGYMYSGSITIETSHVTSSIKGATIIKISSFVPTTSASDFDKGHWTLNESGTSIRVTYKASGGEYLDLHPESGNVVSFSVTVVAEANGTTYSGVVTGKITLGNADGKVTFNGR